MTADEIRESLRAEGIPEHLWAGIIRYVIDRIRPGGFLCAVIRMDVEEAHRRVFPPTRPAIPKLTTWFLTQVPEGCCGTPTCIEDWITGRTNSERQTS